MIGGKLDVMTEADESAAPGVRPGWRWDVALSFASAQRDYVEQVARTLQARGVRCFYDADEQIDLWGKYLAEELPAIYGEQAAAVVVFVSAEYAVRDWTRLERRVALDRAVRERREYVLPARFDDTPLPGLLSGMAWVDLRGRSPQEFAAMIARKLAALAITPSVPSRSPAGSAIIPAAVPHVAVPAPPPPTPVLPSHLVRTLTGTTGGVNGVAFSPDGQLLATACSNATAQLWDPNTGDCLLTLTGHTGQVRGVAFSPDGRLLATASGDDMARLWNPNTGDCLRTLSHTGQVRGVAFSPDGQLLATASSNATAQLWDPNTGRCLRTLTGHTAWVWGVAFSPDGRLLATASEDKTARLWNPATGDCLRTLGHTGQVSAVAFSPDGRLLATGDDERARLWNPATGRCLRTLTGYPESVRGVAFSPDGRLLATAGDARARLWNPATGEFLCTLGHTQLVTGVAFSLDGRLLATAGDGVTARVWN